MICRCSCCRDPSSCKCVGKWVLREIYNPHPDATDEYGVGGMAVHWDDDMREQAKAICDSRFKDKPRCPTCGGWPR